MTNPLLNWLRNRSIKNLLAPLKVELADSALRDAKHARLTDEQLKGRVFSLRQSIEAKTYTPEVGLGLAISLVREAIIRTMGVTPYDTQILAGLALYRGAMAEMGTGEGKTLAAPFAAAAHWLLHGRPVHISTANEYLAQRDAMTLLPLYQFLGMTVGVALADQAPAVKRQVYSCHVVYSTHQTLAQDFLRDHLVREDSAAVMRQLGALIVDEADAAFIDEARMPIVLSAQVPVQPGLYEALCLIARDFVRTEDEHGKGDFWVDGKDRLCIMTDAGYERATQALFAHGLMHKDTELYDDDHQALLLKLSFSLNAQHLLFAEQHYVVQDNAVVLIDASTGRLVKGRRWDSGLQQALEAKENVPLSPEPVTLARITLQHFFRQYQSLSGMTGTAMDDAEELSQVYGLAVVVIPPRTPSLRIDEEDRFYRTQQQKLDAVVADVMSSAARGQPVLIGTSSVSQSAELSARLTAAGLPHEVLNATQHDREGEIIAGAGYPGRITVSTNMAGRGVDIMMGGSVRHEMVQYVESTGGREAWFALSEENRQSTRKSIQSIVDVRAENVRKAGGLRVIGLERYESRRIDRQLRGRCARQGDPGSTCFYLSLEDSLVENFAGERIRGIFAMLDIAEGDDFESAMVKKAVDAAQREVEGRAQTARRQLMDFESVLESQRKVIYQMRLAIRQEPGIEQALSELVDSEARAIVMKHLPERDFPESWDLPGLRAQLKLLGVYIPESDAVLVEREFDVLQDQVGLQMQMHRVLRLEQVEPHEREGAQRQLCLEVLDRLWIQHLGALETLRRGIHLRQHAKIDPRQAYAKEAFALFASLLDDLARDQLRAALTWQAVISGEKNPADPATTDT